MSGKGSFYSLASAVAVGTVGGIADAAGRLCTLFWVGPSSGGQQHSSVAGDDGHLDKERLDTADSAFFADCGKTTTEM